MIKKEELQYKIVYDTRDGINNLGYLREELNRLNQARKQTADTKIQNNLDKEMSNLVKLISQQRDALGLLGLDAKELRAKVKDLRIDLSTMIPGSEKAAEFRAELEKINEILKGKGMDTKDQDITSLRLMIRDGDIAKLSISQLQKLSSHFYDTMQKGAQSGAIEQHELYNEWKMVASAISNAKDLLNQNKVAEDDYRKLLLKRVETYGVEKMSLEHLKEYHKILQEEIQKTDEFESEANQNKIKHAQEVDAMISRREKLIKDTSSAEIQAIQNTIDQNGIAELSIEELEKMSKHMYDTMIKGSKNSAIEQHALYGQYTKVTKAINDSKDALNKNKIAEKEYRKTITDTVQAHGAQALSLDHLKEYYKILQEQIAETSDFESEANQKRIQEAQQVEEMVNQRQSAIKGTTSLWGSIKSQLPGALAGGIAGAIVVAAQEAFTQISAFVGTQIEGIKKKAREITEIQTSLDISRSKASQINKELGKLDTATPREELKQLVEVAGDINVATKEVVAFVEEADKLSTVLKKDFGGSAETAVTEVAKLKEEFKQTRDIPISESLSKIGSVLKKLNLEGPATTSGITDFLKRTGQLPDALKPSIAQLAAFGAVFEEANLSSEVSSSGFSKILTTAANNTKLFAKQLHMSQSELKKLINEDPSKFVLRFASSLKGLDGIQTANTLKGLRLESEEVLRVTGVLADNVDKIRIKQAIANKTFEEGAEIQRIFGEINSDDAAKIEKLDKAITKIKMAFTSLMASAILPIVNLLDKLNTNTKTNSQLFDEQRKKAALLEKNVSPLVTEFNELQKNQKKTAEQQARLKEITGELAREVPGAVTEWDKYGNAISVNIGLVNDFIDKQKKLADSMKWGRVDELNKENNLIGGQRADFQKKLKELVDKPIKTEDDLAKIKQLNLALTNLNKKLIENKTRVKELVTGKVAVPAKEEEKDTWVNHPTNFGGDTGKANAHKKWLQDSHNQMVELRAKLAYEERLASAKEHDKKILQLEKQAKDELKQVHNQFKDENGIVIYWSKLSKEQQELIHKEEGMIKRRLAEQKIQLQKELNEKLDAQYEAQANKAVELAVNSRRSVLQKNLTSAEKKGTDYEQYNAKLALQGFNEAQELHTLTQKYQNEQKALKDNEDALKLLEQNYQAERNAITLKGVQERDQLLEDYSEKEKNRQNKSKLESLQLTFREKGGDPLQEQISILEEQKRQELSVKNLTEQEKTNIQRKYALERAALEKATFMGIAQQAVELFSQSFSSIGNFYKATMNSKEQDTNDTYNREIQTLENQKAKNLITEKQYNDRKLALDKKLDKETKKLKREQAVIDRATQVTQITISGILAAMKAYEQAGPFGGTIGAAIMGAITAANVAAVLAEPLPSLYTGGRTNDVHPGGDVDGKGGFLMVGHPNEFMVNPVATAHPQWPVLEPILEQMNKGRMVNFANMVGGGSASNTTTQTAPIDIEGFNQSLQMFHTFVKMFGEKMETPIVAKTVWDHKDVYELEQKKQELSDTLKDSFSTTNKSLIK